MPFCNRELRANNGCTFPVSVFQDLKQYEFYLLCNGLQSKIIEDDELCLFEEVEPFDERSVGFCYCDLFTEPVKVEVEGSMTVCTSLVSQGAGKE